MAKAYDAIVIGAGVIGASVALALARKGRSVLSIDKLPAAGYGSTSGSCAIIRPFYSTVDGSALAYESHFYWMEWEKFLGAADERGFARYVNCGSFVVKCARNKYLEPILKVMKEIGCPYRELQPEDVKKKLPFVFMESFDPPRRPEDPEFSHSNGQKLPGVVHFTTSGYVNDPQLAAHNLQVAAEAAGAAFKFNAEITEILKKNGRVAGVRLKSGEEIAAPVVVNVGGPHSFKINRMADVEGGMNIKTKALRHEVAHVPSPEGFDYEHNGLHFSDQDTSCYARPEIGNHILIGSEDPECDTKEWVDPDNFNREFTEQWRVQVMRMAQRFTTLPIPNKMKGLVDLYDVSDDWIPIYDKSSLPGFYMAVGTSGNQFKNAPIVGEMMTDLITACEDGRDHDKDPVPFHLKHIDRTINLGFYSRLRKPDSRSSFSVLG
ncbi:MAG TPA: FAD-dependent oxidoreductase [Dongiaceae bacterium]|jgi:sarcosine oxidase subunit beta